MIVVTVGNHIQWQDDAPAYIQRSVLAGWAAEAQECIFPVAWFLVLNSTDVVYMHYIHLYLLTCSTRSLLLWLTHLVYQRWLLAGYRHDFVKRTRAPHNEYFCCLFSICTKILSCVSNIPVHVFCPKTLAQLSVVHISAVRIVFFHFESNRIVIVGLKSHQ